MTNFGASPGADGAFERFLTAAIATIITVMFSWRLLLEEQEAADRAAGGLPPSRASLTQEPSSGRSPQASKCSDTESTQVTTSPTDTDHKSPQSHTQTTVVETLECEPEPDLDLQATPPADGSADDSLTTWDDYSWEADDLDEERQNYKFHTRRTVRDFLTQPIASNASEIENESKATVSSEGTDKSPNQSFTQRFANFEYRQMSGDSGYIDLYPDVESEEETDSSDDEHVYEIQVSDSESEEGEGGFYGVTTLEPIQEEEADVSDGCDSGGEGQRASDDVTDRSEWLDDLTKRDKSVGDNEPGVDSDSDIQQTGVKAAEFAEPCRNTSHFTTERVIKADCNVVPCEKHLIANEPAEECDIRDNSPGRKHKQSIEVANLVETGTPTTVVQKVDNRLVEVTGNTAYVLDLSHTQALKASIPPVDPDLRSVSELSDDSLPPSPVRTNALADDDLADLFSDTESCSSESVVTVLSLRSGDVDLRSLDAEENRFDETALAPSVLCEDASVASQRYVDHTHWNRHLLIDSKSDLPNTVQTAADTCISYASEPDCSEIQLNGTGGDSDGVGSPDSQSAESLISPDSTTPTHATSPPVVNGELERHAMPVPASDTECYRQYTGSDSSSDSSDPPLREYDPDDDDLAEFYLVVGDEGSLRNFETFSNLDSVGLSPDYSDAVTSSTMPESAKGFTFSKTEEISTDFKKRAYFTDRYDILDSDSNVHPPLSPISSDDGRHMYDIREESSDESKVEHELSLEQGISKPKVDVTDPISENTTPPCTDTSTVDTISPVKETLDFNKYIIQSDVQQPATAEDGKKRNQAKNSPLSTDIDLSVKYDDSELDIDRRREGISAEQDGEVNNLTAGELEASAVTVEVKDVTENISSEHVPLEADTSCDRLIDTLFSGIDSDGSDSGIDKSRDEIAGNGQALIDDFGGSDSSLEPDSFDSKSTDTSSKTKLIETNVDDLIEDTEETGRPRLSDGNVQYESETVKGAAAGSAGQDNATLSQYETLIDDLFKGLDSDNATTDESKPNTQIGTCVNDPSDVTATDNVQQHSPGLVQYQTSHSLETNIDDIPEHVLEHSIVADSRPSVFSIQGNKQTRSIETCIDDDPETRPVALTCQDSVLDSEPGREAIAALHPDTEEQLPGSSAGSTLDTDDQPSTPSTDTAEQTESSCQRKQVDQKLGSLTASDPTGPEAGNLLASGKETSYGDRRDNGDICHSGEGEQNAPHIALSQTTSITTARLGSSPERTNWQQFKGPTETIADDSVQVVVEPAIHNNDKQSYHGQRNSGDSPEEGTVLSEGGTVETKPPQKPQQLDRGSESQTRTLNAETSNLESLHTDLDSVTAISTPSEATANLSLSKPGICDSSVHVPGWQPETAYSATHVSTPTDQDQATQPTTEDAPSGSARKDESSGDDDEVTSDVIPASSSKPSRPPSREPGSLESIERIYTDIKDAYNQRVLDRHLAEQIIRTPVRRPSDYITRTGDLQGVKKRIHRHQAKQYFSILQQPVTPEKGHFSFSTPEKEVPVSRKRITQSRQRFLSSENLADSFDEQFTQHKTSLVSSTPRKYLKRHERHLQDGQSTESLPTDISGLNSSFSSTGSMDRYSSYPRSSRRIEELYSPRQSANSSFDRPDYDKLHANCLFSPGKQEEIREIRHSTKSLENMFEQLLRYGSVSSLIETDLDTGVSSQSDLMQDIDISDYVSFQYPLERAASMSALTGSSDGHRLPRKPGKGRFASKLVPKSKSLQTLETNLDDIFAAEADAPGELKKTPSVHELRVSKSLSKLHVPDWFKKSTFSRSDSTQSLFTYARQGSTSTLGSVTYPASLTSSPSPSVTPGSNAVVIKTRVTPTSSTSAAARLIRAPLLPTTPEKSPIHPTSSVSLPSDRFRKKDKKDLKPIAIVPFAKIREMFERKSTSQSKHKTSRPPLERVPSKDNPVHVSDLAHRFQPASPTSPPGEDTVLAQHYNQNHQAPPVPERKPIIHDRATRSHLDENQQQNSQPRKPQVHFSDEKHVSNSQEQNQTAVRYSKPQKPQSLRPSLPMPQFRFRRPASSPVTPVTSQSKKGKVHVSPNADVTSPGLHVLELKARNDGERLFEFLQKRRYSSLLENGFAEQLNDLQDTENTFSFPVLSTGKHSTTDCRLAGADDLHVMLTNACLQQLEPGGLSGQEEEASLEDVLEGLLALKEQREAALRMEGDRTKLKLSADSPTSPGSPAGPGQGSPGYVSDNVFKDCYANDTEDQCIDMNYMLVRCENPECRRETNLREARQSFKTCHSCFSYYCSRSCRQLHWERHKQYCVYSRINSACKHVIKAVNRSPHCQYYCSRLARRGYLSQGRGCVVFAFPDLSSTEDFLCYGVDSLWVPPMYVSLKDLPQADMLGTRLEMVTKTCKQYNPELKYVIHVAIVIPPKLPPAPIPRKLDTIIQKCAKLRLSPAHMHPKQEEPEVPTTMILTAIPGNKETNGTNERKTRELCFINIQRKLRQRGVSLRHQFPNVYNKLIDFVSDSKHFSPLIIFPQDSRSGKRFMCVIMPESEPEIEWIRDRDLFHELDMFEDDDYDSSPLSLSVPDLCATDASY